MAEGKEGKASYSNMTVEAEITVYEKKGDTPFITDISNNEDYKIYVVYGYVKGRNYKEHEWTRWYKIKFIGAATNNLVNSLKPKDLLRVRGDMDIENWRPKDLSEDENDIENEVLVIDVRKGGFWAHSNRWTGSVSLEQEDRGSSKSRRDDDDGEEDDRSSRRRGRSSRDDEDGEDDAPRRGRGRSRSRDDEDGEDDEPRRGRGRSRSRDEDGEDEEETPRRRSRSRDDEDGEDDEPRGRSRRNRRRGDADDD